MPSQLNIPIGVKKRLCIGDIRDSVFQEDNMEKNCAFFKEMITISVKLNLNNNTTVRTVMMLQKEAPMKALLTRLTRLIHTSALPSKWNL